MSKKIKEEEYPEKILMAKGTTLQFGGESVELTEDTKVSFPGAGDEMKFAAMCAMEGDLEVNAPNFKFQYDNLGNPLDLSEQLVDSANRNDFVKSLKDVEAYKFRVLPEWETLNKSIKKVKEVKEVKKVADVTDVADVADALYPTDFPGQESLEKAKIAFSSVATMTDEELLEVNGIGKATLKEIRSFESE